MSSLDTPISPLSARRRSRVLSGIDHHAFPKAGQSSDAVPINHVESVSLHQQSQCLTRKKTLYAPPTERIPMAIPSINGASSRNSHRSKKYEVPSNVTSSLFPNGVQPCRPVGFLRGIIAITTNCRPPHCRIPITCSASGLSRKSTYQRPVSPTLGSPRLRLLLCFVHNKE